MSIDYLYLIRPSNWIKNLFVFVPLAFGGLLFEIDALLASIVTFGSFSLAASTVYIINDLGDIEEDKLHPVKKFRPLASGKVSFNGALVTLVLLCTVNAALLWFMPVGASVLIIIYLLLNLLYTFWLKREPIWDIALIAIFFVLRIEAGAQATNIAVSGWLFVTTFFGSMLLAAAKRLAEYKGPKVRVVMQKYSQQFLESIMYLCATVTIVAYTIYAINLGNNYLISLVVLTIGIIRFIFIVQNDTQEKSDLLLILQDKQLIVLILIFFSYSLLLIY